MKTKKTEKIFALIFTISVIISATLKSPAQTAINNTGNNPDASAMLDVSASAQGILLPRLTSVQRNAIPSPAAGLLIYNTTTHLFNYYNGSEWYEIAVTYVSSANGSLHPGKGTLISKVLALPDSSAILDVSDTSRGMLIPRIANTGAITTPATALIIYNTTTNSLNYYNGSVWVTPCAITTGVSGATGIQNAAGTAINKDGSVADASAILDVSSSDKGILIPRVTTSERNNIKPVSGLSVYNTTTNAIEYYNGSGWYMLEYNTPSSLTAGTHIPSATQIVWNWNSIAGATGYKWHTANTYSAATDMNTNITKTETGLTCNTSYTRYVWAYNTCGNSNSTTLTQTTSVCPFTCGTSLLTDTRDNKTYSTVQIGTQCWMKQNLNYGTYVTNTTGQTPSGIQKYCYSNNTANCTTYGGLYIWSEIMNGSVGCNGISSLQPACSTPVQGICPDGWHLPSHYEWTVLERTVGLCPGCFPYNTTTKGWLGTNEGTNLKSSGSSGFEGLYAGIYYGGFKYMGDFSNYWTSSQYSANYSWYRCLRFIKTSSYRWEIEKTTGLSVRCIKN